MQDTYVEIYLDKIIDNINKIKKVNPRVIYCAVVKADAYGLGAVIISKAIEIHVDYFAVARFSEALELRNSGIKKPILILGYVSLDNIKACHDLDIDISVYDLDQAIEINKIGYRVKCQLALDTGHSRLGFRDFELDKVKKLKDLNNLNFIGAFSHFSTADENDPTFMNLQVKRYKEMLDRLKGDFSFKLTHIANSAAALNYGTKQNMVRIGLSTYGLYPSDFIKSSSDVKLSKAFKIYSTVSFVKNIKANTSVSYGRTFISKTDMKLATVTIGYADGYPRAFSNCGELTIAGRKCRVLGRVCMDQVIVDVSGLNVKIGDRVEVYEEIDKEALKIDTINYELMTNLSKRVERRYFFKKNLVKDLNSLGDLYES